MCNSADIEIVSLNVRSINKALDKLKLIIQDYEPDILALQEIWKIDTKRNYKLNNYHPPILRGREAGQGGGIAIYVKKKMELH